MEFAVSWYDGLPIFHWQLGNGAPMHDVQEHERLFETEIEALAFALDLVSHRNAYTVTMQAPDGARRSGVHLRLKFRELGLVGSATGARRNSGTLTTFTCKIV